VGVDKQRTYRLSAEVDTQSDARRSRHRLTVRSTLNSG
jgi:hypothetical protein